MARDSVSKRLGVKEFGGTFVTAGSIIIPPAAAASSSPAKKRRRRSADWTLFALTDGKVAVRTRNSRRVNVVAEAAAAKKINFGNTIFMARSRPRLFLLEFQALFLPHFHLCKANRYRVKCPP